MSFGAFENEWAWSCSIVSRTWNLGQLLNDREFGYSNFFTNLFVFYYLEYSYLDILQRELLLAFSLLFSIYR